MESVERLMLDLNFFKDKKVFLTGHTGFKGTWLTKILVNAGALVTGYSLAPKGEPNLYELSGVDNQIESVIADIRDLDSMNKVFERVQPEIVIHMAAQPLVIDSYENPVYTYDTNVMGTVNICECVRKNPCVKSFLNVTTDKVYHNNEWEWGYRENDPLDGFDPYSNSKSCSELVTHCYNNSFFKEMGIATSTARAGNVIGGGDFAENRIIPDCVRAVSKQEKIFVRNPNSTRPYQHVLEPLLVYLTVVKEQYEDISFSGYYNVGPDECDCVTTGELVELFCNIWDDGASWYTKTAKGPHEANFLKLDCSKIKNVFQWKPIWHIEDAIVKTISWWKAYHKEEEMGCFMDSQIHEFFEV